MAIYLITIPLFLNVREHLKHINIKRIFTKFIFILTHGITIDYRQQFAKLIKQIVYIHFHRICICFKTCNRAFERFSRAFEILGQAFDGLKALPNVGKARPRVCVIT